MFAGPTQRFQHKKTISSILLSNIVLQVCKIHLVVDESDTGDVSIVLGESILKANKEMSEYFITDDPKSPTLSFDGKNGMFLNIIFKRRLTNEALMTFLPSLLLITISYATSYFRLPNFFNTAITVNLTVLLTTTTLLISINKKLATTGYIKWIEAWLIFAQFVPFVQVILITGIEQLRERQQTEVAIQHKEDEPEMKRSDKHIWLDVKDKLVKVNCLSFNFTLQNQVYPLEPTPRTPERLKTSWIEIISFFGKKCIFKPNFNLVAFFRDQSCPYNSVDRHLHLLDIWFNVLL